MAMLSHSGHTLMHVYTKIKHANNLLLRFSHVIYAITSPDLPTTLTLKNDIKAFFLNRAFYFIRYANTTNISKWLLIYYSTNHKKTLLFHVETKWKMLWTKEYVQ